MPNFDIITISPKDTDPETQINKISDRYTGLCNPGDNIFYTKDGQIVNQAKFENIDWDKMKEVANQKAINNAEESNISDGEKASFIEIRKKVHLRPHSFIDRLGNFYSEEDIAGDVHESLVRFQNEWDTALTNTQSEDTLTHWKFSA